MDGHLRQAAGLEGGNREQQRQDWAHLPVVPRMKESQEKVARETQTEVE